MQIVEARLNDSLTIGSEIEIKVLEVRLTSVRLAIIQTADEPKYREVEVEVSAEDREMYLRTRYPAVASRVQD